MPVLSRLTLIGVGLIGGSFVRALRRAGLCEEVVGCGRGIENLTEAVQLGVIDRYDTNPARAVVGADMVIIAVPLQSMAGIFSEIYPNLSNTCIVSDVGSVKQSVVTDAINGLGAKFPQFVPAHPIAGTEKSGVTASFADLFVGRRVILTPVATTAITATEAVTALWEAVGAQVMYLSPEAHDAILAATSHLPHVLAYNMVHLLAQAKTPDIFQFAGSGFRDFSRIAASDPAVWRDICLTNRDALLTVIDQFSHDLNELKQAIAENDGKTLFQIFQQAKIARDNFGKS